jgi:hypothetical protein
MRRQIRLSADPTLRDLLDEALSYPGEEDIVASTEPHSPVIPMRIVTRLGVVSFLSATTVFGNPADITLDEIALEMLYPADAFTKAAVQGKSSQET